MSKSKALALAPDPMARHILHLREYHRSAMMAGLQSIAAAIFTGLELLAVQEELKKCTTCTNVSGGKLLSYDEWLDTHLGELGFSRRTAYKYAKLAKGQRKRMEGIEPLISFAPSALAPEQQKRLPTTGR